MPAKSFRMRRKAAGTKAFALNKKIILHSKSNGGFSFPYNLPVDILIRHMLQWENQPPCNKTRILY